MKRLRACGEVLIAFLRLGLTSFGGPVAHLGYFHDEFVRRRKWISDDAYLDLVSLCQLLPGPASSQVGISIGLLRAGPLGAIASWLGFTLPSAVLLVAFALGLSHFEMHLKGGLLQGLKVVAVSVVARALWVMGCKRCPDRRRATLAVCAAVLTLWVSTGWVQIVVLMGGAIVGWICLPQSDEPLHSRISVGISKKAASVSLAVFALLLFLLPWYSSFNGDPALCLFSGFFRVGSVVFGGGHVVLPFLQDEVVPRGLVTNDAFMAGYGAAQAIPGPLFAFAAYLGAILKGKPSGLLGAVIALVAIYLPSFLLLVGVIPFWEKLQTQKRLKSAVMGINAAVVGILLSAFYTPVWTSAIKSPRDFALATLSLLLLTLWKTPNWAVVLISALLGTAFL